MSNQPALPDVGVTTRPQEREQTRTRRIPPYHVILENDDHHTMDFVTEVLQKVLGCPMEKAVQLMLQAHHAGRAVIWTGTREVAELKAEQIRTFHETHPETGAQLGPLGCSIEPAPGA
jgi:ATP-dependent Clp protease adaptor protein ClpS